MLYLNFSSNFRQDDQGAEASNKLPVPSEKESNPLK